MEMLLIERIQYACSVVRLCERCTVTIRVKVEGSNEYLFGEGLDSDEACRYGVHGGFGETDTICRSSLWSVVYYLLMSMYCEIYGITLPYVNRTRQG